MTVEQVLRRIIKHCSDGTRVPRKGNWYDYQDGWMDADVNTIRECKAIRRELRNERKK